MNKQFIAYRFSGNIEKELYDFRQFCYEKCLHPSWQMYPPIAFASPTLDKVDLAEWQVLNAPLRLSKPVATPSGQIYMICSLPDSVPSTKLKTGFSIDWMPISIPGIPLGIWHGNDLPPFDRVIGDYRSPLTESCYPENVSLIGINISTEPWNSVEWEAEISEPVRKKPV